jgi:hypothetical protein
MVFNKCLKEKLEKCEENVKNFLLQTDTGSKGGEGKERVI